jgi:multimeric flavodoxin WrbA
MRETLNAIQELGGDTELITVAGKNIKPCDSCLKCAEKGICRIKDDMQEIYSSLLKADGIILGTPVYFFTVSAQAKIIMDRLYSLYVHRKLAHKVGGIIVASRRTGASQVISLLSSYFLVLNMHVAGLTVGYGWAKGEVKEGVGAAPNKSALEEARGLGKSVVSLHKRLAK